jgi:tRNA C32,U32 (ribose-2'-O)-methylase TrmJ
LGILVNPLHFLNPQATSISTGEADLLENIIVAETLSEAQTGCAFIIGINAHKRLISHKQQCAGCLPNSPPMNHKRLLRAFKRNAVK